MKKKPPKKQSIIMISTAKKQLKDVFCHNQKPVFHTAGSWVMWGLC